MRFEYSHRKKQNLSKYKHTQVPVRSATSYLDNENESQQILLCAYADCTIPSDGDIAFLVRPILRDAHVPPAIAWEHLRLMSPPPLHDVLKHVDLLTKCRWTWHHSLVETFQSVFAFLQNTGLSSRPSNNVIYAH